MKKIISALLGFLMVVAVVAEADAKSRGGGFSSSRSSFSTRSAKSSSSKPRPAVRSKPIARSLPKYSAPRAATAKPVAKQSVVASKPMASQRVASTSFKRTPVRKVTSPIAARKTTVIQKNYYGGRYSGYGNGYRGYNNFGSGYGNSYGSGSGFGSSLVGGALGAFGGMWFYNALNNDEPQPSVFDQMPVEGQAPVEEPVSEVNPYEPIDNFTVDGVLPSDAPLMMNPNYYQQ